MVDGEYEIQSDKNENNQMSMQEQDEKQKGPGMHYDDISQAQAPYLVLPNVDVEYQVIGEDKLVVMHMPESLVAYWFKDTALPLRDAIEKLISPESIVKKEAPKIEEGDKVKLRDLKDRRSTLAPTVLMG